MKKILVGLICLTILACKSQHINLTGKYDFVIDNKMVGTLTLQQNNEGQLTGFLSYDRIGDNRRTEVYQVKGFTYYDSKPKKHKVGIIVYKNQYSGYASDSNSIIGTWIRSEDQSSHEWMAIKKQN